MSKHTDAALAKVARLDGDIAALRARLEAKLDERQTLLNDLLADGEAIRMAISAEPIAPLVAVSNSTRTLAEDQVREIRALHASGTLSQGAIARRFGLSQPSVNAIVNRRSYKDVA